jgi:hypothetical protein
MQDNAVQFTEEIYHQMEKVKEYKFITEALMVEVTSVYTISKYNLIALFVY